MLTWRLLTTLSQEKAKQDPSPLHGKRVHMLQSRDLYPSQYEGHEEQTPTRLQSTLTRGPQGVLGLPAKQFLQGLKFPLGTIKSPGPALKF